MSSLDGEYEIAIAELQQLHAMYEPKSGITTGSAQVETESSEDSLALRARIAELESELAKYQQQERRNIKKQLDFDRLMASAKEYRSEISNMFTRLSAALAGAISEDRAKESARAGLLAKNIVAAEPPGADQLRKLFRQEEDECARECAMRRVHLLLQTLSEQIRSQNARMGEFEREILLLRETLLK